jgi:hypothetical protein
VEKQMLLDKMSMMQETIDTQKESISMHQQQIEKLKTGNQQINKKLAIEGLGSNNRHDISDISMDNAAQNINELSDDSFMFPKSPLTKKCKRKSYNNLNKSFDDSDLSYDL